MTPREFAIADTHFGQARIIARASRPYRNVDEMDGDLMRRWNAVVGPEDIVWHLGDFAGYGGEHAAERISAVLAGLNGRKRLIKGNLDRRSARFWREAGFEAVYNGPVLHPQGDIIFSHAPLEIAALRGAGRINVHGHTHGRLPNGPGRPFHFCVSVELIDYRPILLSEIRQRIMDRGTRKDITP